MTRRAECRPSDLRDGQLDRLGLAAARQDAMARGEKMVCIKYAS